LPPPLYTYRDKDLILDLTNKTQLVILCAFHETGCPEIYRKGRDESETRIADSGTCVCLYDKTKERRWKNWESISLGDDFDMWAP